MESTTFNEFDETILDNIFKFLSLWDLAAMSVTCKRYQTQAERYFTVHHEINCKPIAITSTNEAVDFEFESAPQYKYEKVFEKLIRSVNFNLLATLTHDDVDFVKEYCAKRLRSLTLNFVNARGDERIDSSPIGEIKEQLKDLKELKIVNYSVRDLHRDMLQYCGESVESFTIEITRGGHDEFYGVFGDNWTKHSYPNMKTLKLCVPKYLRVDISSFFEFNPSLDNFICNHLWSIHDVCYSEKEFLYVAFVYCYEHDFTWSMDAMAKWSKRKRFNEFELVISVHEFQYNVMHGMATTIENISSLHLGHNVDYFLYCQLNMSLPSVNMLCVDYEPYEGSPEMSAQVIYDQLNKFFPNLQKLIAKIANPHVISDVVLRFKESKKIFEFGNEKCELCTLSKYTDLDL